MFRPFRALANWGVGVLSAMAYDPGWRFALPWAISLSPVGAKIRLRIGVERILQAMQVVVGYSGWRLPDGFMPQRAAGSRVHSTKADGFMPQRGARGKPRAKRSAALGSGTRKFSRALKGRNNTTGKPMRDVHIMAAH